MTYKLKPPTKPNGALLEFHHGKDSSTGPFFVYKLEGAPKLSMATTIFGDHGMSNTTVNMDRAEVKSLIERLRDGLHYLETLEK
jgi:hypothetical protein